MVSILGAAGPLSSSGTLRPLARPARLFVLATTHYRLGGFSNTNALLRSSLLFLTPCPRLVPRHLYLGYDFLSLHAAGTNLGKEVGAEHADREHDDNERDDEVDERRNDLTNLQGDTTHSDLCLRDTLTGRQSGGNDGRDQTLRQGSEKLGDNAPQIDSSRDDDDILGVQHLFVEWQTYFSKRNHFYPRSWDGV